MYISVRKGLSLRKITYAVVAITYQGGVIITHTRTKAGRSLRITTLWLTSLHSTGICGDLATSNFTDRHLEYRYNVHPPLSKYPLQRVHLQCKPYKDYYSSFSVRFGTLYCTYTNTHPYRRHTFACQSSNTRTRPFSQESPSSEFALILLSQTPRSTVKWSPPSNV